MAKYTATLTADGRTTAFPYINTRADGNIWATVFVYGTFGSGTATVQVSPDAGTTWIDVEDDGGSVVSFTADGARNVRLASDAGEPVLISVDLSGATSPDLTVDIFQVR